jgi:hypothetical protein
MEQSQIFEEQSKPKRPSNLVYPTIRFEDYYSPPPRSKGRRFSTVRELSEDDEFKNVYSHFYEFTKFELDIPIGEKIEDQENFSPEQQIKELIKCTNDFFYWSHRYVKILHPVHGTIPFVLYKYQRKVINRFTEHGWNMLSKFRQGGLTTVAVLWGLWRCLFQQDQQIYVLSKTDREALAAGDIAKKAMDNFPSWMYDQAQADISKHEKKFGDTGSKISFYTPEAARGKSATLLIIDEAAFIPDMYEHYKAMYPVISTGGNIAVISTVNGIGNWYYDTYKEAESGRNFFKIIDLDYWEHPIYANPEWAKKTKANMSEKAWQQEILRDFLGSGETYIPTRIIGQLDRFTRNNAPIRTAFEKYENKGKQSSRKADWERGALWIWKEPADGHEYIVAVDSAEGVEGGDNSCFQIIDVATLEQVAEFYSNIIPPHIYAQIINQIAIYYNVATVVVESNTVGGAVLSNLQNDLAYENLYFEQRKKATSPGVKIGPANRGVYLEALQHRLVNGTLRINSRRFVQELSTFIWSRQKRRAEAEKGKHDDAIMAMAIGLFIRDERMRGIPVGSEIPDEMVKVFKSDTYEEIKREILEGRPEDWLSEDNYDPISVESSEELLLPTFNIPKRKNDALLREFGW